MTDISVVFAIGLAVGFAVGYAVRAAISSSSRNEAALPFIARRDELSSWVDLGQRWPTRLVATAAESRLSFQHNPYNVVCGSQRLRDNCNFGGKSASIRARGPIRGHLAIFPTDTYRLMLRL